METNLAGFTFFSNFDSGNLQKIILDDDEPEEDQLSEEHQTQPKGVDRKQKQAQDHSQQRLAPTDFAFKIWTRPDCAGTEYENGNRTWFFFAIRPSPHVFVTPNGCAGKVLKFTVMNLNKQTKLFSQGMSPIYMIVPQGAQLPSYHSQVNGGWQRVRERPTYWTPSGSENFLMSFRILIEPGTTTTYVAFTYPYSYKDLQGFLAKLDRKHGIVAEKSFEDLSKMSPNTIYFRRENVCYSLQNRRVDLLTITGLNGLLSEREETLEKLFPEGSDRRPFKFSVSKKTVFVSARVHPGETQSSFVMLGFLKFLLRESDPRSVALRRKYVFKLIPMLNPDGVVNGHYRTDCRGVNLNRVYARPIFEVHPQIYAARKLILYAHNRKEVLENLESARADEKKSPEFSRPDECLSDSRRSSTTFRLFPSDASITSVGSSNSIETSTSSLTATSSIAQLGYEMSETSRFSEGDESIADFSERQGFGVFPSPHRQIYSSTPGPTTFTAAFAQARSGNRQRRLSFCRDELTSKNGTTERTNVRQELDMEDANKNVLLDLDPSPVVADEENANLDFTDKFLRPTTFSIPPGRSTDTNLRDNNIESSSVDSVAKDSSTALANVDVPVWDAKTSGLSLYVDIHGHASKRGIFMYGNYFNDVETQAACMLLPKLMSINCANFDFPACNFTERNMYLKDRHTGAGREGSGRVSVYKSTGLINSFTLECNFNTGRVVNGVPMASRDAGRATPPPPPHPLPQNNPMTGTTPNSILQDQVAPKYTPEIYEDAGKALATSLLDMSESNPWTRLTCSAFKNLRGVREWLRKYIRASKAAAEDGASEGKEGRSRRTRRHRSANSERSSKAFPKFSPLRPESSSRRSLRSSSRRVRNQSQTLLTTTTTSKESTCSVSPLTVAKCSSSAERPARRKTSSKRKKEAETRANSTGRTKQESLSSSRPGSSSNPQQHVNQTLRKSFSSTRSRQNSPSRAEKSSLTSASTSRSMTSKGTKSFLRKTSASDEESPKLTPKKKRKFIGKKMKRTKIILSATGANV